MKKILVLISTILISLTITSCMNNRTVQNGDNISVNYRGTFEDGTQFDSSYDRGQTLDFKVWAGQMIPGFDSGVVGMKVWEKKNLVLSPAEAYGEYDETKKQIVPKKDLVSFTAAWYTLDVWEELPTQYGNLKIIDADEENVTLDLNNPMAGKTLNFEVELVSIN